MIYLGADHRGFELKNEIKGFLAVLGYDYEDFGAFGFNQEDDYPDFAKAVAERVAVEPVSRGILICSSGIGMAVAANKIKGIRAGTAMKKEQARAGVNDDNMNVLALAVDYISKDEAKEIVKTFLETKFSGEERFKRRIKKIE